MRSTENVNGVIGVSLDPKNNSRRYQGFPRAPKETLWGELGRPLALSSTRGGRGASHGPQKRREYRGVP